MTPIALFDLDGTLADYDGAMRRDLALMKSPHEPDDYDMRNPPPHVEERMKFIKQRPGWWKSLEQIKAGFQVLNIAVELEFEIRILTAGPRSAPIAWKEKVEWCEACISGNPQVTITRDKSMVYGRVLVDDYPGYMEGWLSHRPRGLGLMPRYEENKDFQHPNVLHYDESNLDAVRERLIWARDRKDGEG